MENDVISLAKKMIAIPSFVSSTNDESKILEYLETYCKTVFPKLRQEKQYISKSRYNLICKGSKNAELVVLMHVDTVQPQNGWTTNPFTLKIKNNTCFGLGIADMKGATAAFLTALEKSKKSIDIEKVMLVFYVDEEYDFAGMKKFIKTLSQNTPKVYLSLDGDSLQVSNGCRGVIEMQMTFLGKSGHASKPQLGINAIRKVNEAITELESVLEKCEDKLLGQTTLNLAYLQGGILVSNTGGKQWIREGNVIPDYVDCTIEIRPSIKKVTAAFVEKALRKIAKKLSLSVENITIRHDIAPWPSSYKSAEIKNIKKAFNKTTTPFRIDKNKYSGYVDMQMLAEKVKTPIYVIGITGENLHGANENVSIKNLERGVTVYKSIIQVYCQ